MLWTDSLVSHESNLHVGLKNNSALSFFLILCLKSKAIKLTNIFILLDVAATAPIHNEEFLLPLQCPCHKKLKRSGGFEIKPYLWF